ncbi:unannotated protein [freshwater metagenome]|uniref:Unannotated protein n=1 Tax=freshwater metagenome TaxID=449393 RepID=A0A6J6F2P0_9ZZZZ
MLVGGVVRNHINDDSQAQVMSSGDQCLSLSKRAKYRVDVTVIGNVIARVFLRGAIKRREPNRVNPEFSNRRKSADNAREIAHPIPISIGKRPRIDLVNDGVTPPVGG